MVDDRKEYFQSFLDRCFHISYYGASATLLSNSLKKEKEKKKGIQKLKILSLKLQSWGSSSEFQ